MEKVIPFILVLALILVSGCSPEEYDVNEPSLSDEYFMEIMNDMKESNEKLVFLEDNINIERNHRRFFYFFVLNENDYSNDFQINFYCENATNNSANLNDIKFVYDSVQNIEKDEVKVFLAYIEPKPDAVTTNYTCRVDINNGTYSSKKFYINVIDGNPEWFGEPRVNPDFFDTFEPTEVYFEVLVNKPPTALANNSPVKLFRKNGNGDWILLSEMYDDGVLAGHGDKTKGDRVYATVIEFYEEKTIKEMPLKIVVTTSENQNYTKEFSLTVSSEEQFQQMLYEMEEASNRAEKKIKQIMRSNPPDLESVQQELCNYLIEQDDIIADCGVSHNSVWITCNSGAPMEIWLTNLDEGEPLE